MHTRETTLGDRHTQENNSQMDRRETSYEDVT